MLERSYRRESYGRIRPLVLRHLELTEPVFTNESGGTVCILRGSITRDKVRRLVEENRQEVQATARDAAMAAVVAGNQAMCDEEYGEADVAYTRGLGPATAADRLAAGSGRMRDTMALGVETARRLRQGEWKVELVMSPQAPDIIGSVIISWLNREIAGAEHISYTVTRREVLESEMKTSPYAGKVGRLIQPALGGCVPVAWGELPVPNQHDISIELKRSDGERLLLNCDGRTLEENGFLTDTVTIMTAPGDGIACGLARQNENVPVLRFHGGHYLVVTSAGMGWVYQNALTSEHVMEQSRIYSGWGDYFWKVALIGALCYYGAYY